ncbi:helix-turn-helix domain-containing protein [Paenibacillus oceani]|uniref:Helix-turn-helix transcriptional regulator n=1 Tax=Paenibacillus oceani TaxID=2772510 RepID=A0A927C9C1_9BACL|nr:helix-turn-helix transcriptional regulator [Paenibacillus oceani]MBD2862482.1 helix-turn-helix transcriptional regulator [Paenibacillus oceani]
MSDLRKLVGERIRAIRKARGLTQQQLAERSNLDDAYIGSMERGERNFSVDTLEKVISALEIQPMELFYFEGSLNETAAAQRKAIDELTAVINSLSVDQIESFMRVNKELARVFL